jgi:Transposase DDE domain
VLTDLPASAADPCWYALRSWVEQGFKVIKRGGWQWQRTRMTDPDRAARLWVALAVATVWLVEVGGLAECEPRPETVPPLGRLDRPRVHRLFRVGLAVILAGLLVGRVRAGRFGPEPWPTPRPIPALTEEEFRSGMTYP